MIDKAVDSRHLPSVGGNKRVHVFCEKMVELQSFLLWHALDSDQRFSVRVVAPKHTPEDEGDCS